MAFSTPAAACGARQTSLVIVHARAHARGLVYTSAGFRGIRTTVCARAYSYVRVAVRAGACCVCSHGIVLHRHARVHAGTRARACAWFVLAFARHYPCLLLSTITYPAPSSRVPTENPAWAREEGRASVASERAREREKEGGASLRAQEMERRREGDGDRSVRVCVRVRDCADACARGRACGCVRVRVRAAGFLFFPKTSDTAQIINALVVFGPKISSLLSRHPRFHSRTRAATNDGLGSSSAAKGREHRGGWGEIPPLLVRAGGVGSIPAIPDAGSAPCFP
jgi:hypothetical protein